MYSFKLGVLIGVAQVTQDFNHFVLYVLFSKTTYGCDFEKIFGMYFGLSAFALILRKLATGPFTDYMGYSVHRCLVVCAGAQILLLAAMFLPAWSNAWIVIGLQMGLGTANIQAQSCVFKIIKLHLDQSLPGDAEGQHAIINSLEAWGEGMATAFLAAATLATYLLAHSGFSFSLLQWFIFAVPLLFASATLALAASIKTSFISPPPALVAAAKLYATLPDPDPSSFRSLYSSINPPSPNPTSSHASHTSHGSINAPTPEWNSLPTSTTRG